MNSAHDFAGYRRLVEIGGGSGALLDVVLGSHPNLRATRRRPQIIGFGTRPRVELVAAPTS